jgi:hypothetical protein
MRLKPRAPRPASLQGARQLREDRQVGMEPPAGSWHGSGPDVSGGDLQDETSGSAGYAALGANLDQPAASRAARRARYGLPVVMEQERTLSRLAELA